MWDWGMACELGNDMSLQFEFFLKYLVPRLPSKDTYKDIRKYFDIWPVEDQISARLGKFNLRFCVS